MMEPEFKAFNHAADRYKQHLGFFQQLISAIRIIVDTSLIDTFEASKIHPDNTNHFRFLGREYVIRHECKVSGKEGDDGWSVIKLYRIDEPDETKPLTHFVKCGECSMDHFGKTSVGQLPDDASKILHGLLHAELITS